MNHYEQVGLHLIYKNPGRKFNLLNYTNLGLNYTMVCAINADKLTEDFMDDMRTHSKKHKVSVVCVVNSRIRITNRKAVANNIFKASFDSYKKCMICDSVGYLLSNSVQLVKNRWGKNDAVII